MTALGLCVCDSYVMSGSLHAIAPLPIMCLFPHVCDSHVMSGSLHVIAPLSVIGLFPFRGVP